MGSGRAGERSGIGFEGRSWLGAPGAVLGTVVLSFGAVALDQAAAPILFSTAPFVGLGVGGLLVWRRGMRSIPEGLQRDRLKPVRIAVFAALHGLLVLAARALSGGIADASGGYSGLGWLFGAAKLLPLLPALALLTLSGWRAVRTAYAAEAIAGGVALLTFFPQRIVTAAWPWYGSWLGHAVYAISKPLVPSLGYASALYPTLTARELDVTILLSCSGISGLQLFDVLFALIAVCDWNRLNKGRTFAAYWIGLAAMLVANAVRLISFVVLGNHGFGGLLAQVHLSAGWLFFTGAFLIYLFCIYRWMLGQRASRQIGTGESANEQEALSAV